MSSRVDAQALQARFTELEAQLAIASGKAQLDVLRGKEGRVEASGEDHLNAENGPHMEVDVGSDFEEGEINDDHVETVQDAAIQDHPPVGIEQKVKNTEDHTTGMKRKLSPSQEEQRSSKRIQGASSLSFKAMKGPNHPVPCVISINGREPMGSLYAKANGFTITAFIDPGLHGPPTVLMCFKEAGKTSRIVARNCWDTESVFRGQWAMRDVYAGHVTSDETDSRMPHPNILAACRPHDAGKIMYMRFKSWSQVAGHREKSAFRNLSLEERRSTKLMFQPKIPYNLECWFVAPFEPEAFRRRCLAYFNESFANRVRPFDSWQDSNGIYFNDCPLEPPPTFLNIGPNGMVFRTQGPTVTAQQNQHANAAQDTFTLRGITGDEAEQSAAAQDTKMSDISLLLPTADQPISPSTFLTDFEAPKSILSSTNPQSSLFTPAFPFGNYNEDDDDEPESDGGSGPIEIGEGSTRVGRRTTEL